MFYCSTNISFLRLSSLAAVLNQSMGINYANVWHGDVVWCHKVTELKAGLLTRRLWSSVLCGRGELLLVRTLTFKTRTYKTLKERKIPGHFKDFSGQIQGSTESYNTDDLYKSSQNNKKTKKTSEEVHFLLAYKIYEFKHFQWPCVCSCLISKGFKALFFSSKTHHPSRFDLLVDVSIKLEIERTQRLLMRL